MMSIESRVYNSLSGSTVVTSLVGASIYPDHRYQEDETPAVVFWRAPGGVRINDFNGYSGVENPIIEVTVYSSSVDTRREVSDAVISVMTDTTFYSCILPDPPFDDYDDETKIYERTMQFSVWYRAT